MAKPELQQVWSSPVLCIASGFGVGLAPWAPGTFGTLAAALLFIPMATLDWWVTAGLVAVATAAGIPVCQLAATRHGQTDPGWIVWDEMVAVWLLLLLLDGPWPWLVLALALFRLLDILKPWLISWLERTLKGGLGIMADDLLAGCGAWLLVAGLQRLFSS